MFLTIKIPMINEPNEKTVMRTRRTPFRPSRPSSEPERSVNVLPVGTHLGEFEILDLIGEGGFGIVYMAYDHSLERHVALKEYMPSGLATRTTKMAVTVRSQHNASTFTAGLKSFINEARMLAQFDSASLVKVHRFWEGNGTAYMVMPFYEGTTLKQAVKERRIKPTETWIRLLLADLFDAIEIIHHSHCLHRDIAPDNILLLKDGRPLLLDFGAARRVIGDLTQCLTAILKPGYAPIEQYADIDGLRQGAWTDIYALAAVVYYLITGKAPPPAVARMVRDELVPAREAGKGRYSDTFLAALDKALAVKPEQRFRSIAEMRRAVDIMETVPRTLPRTSSDLATTVVRTAPLAEPVPKEDMRPKGKPAAKPNPNSNPKQPNPKEVAKPEIQHAEKPGAKQDAKPAPTHEARQEIEPAVHVQATARPNHIPDVDYWKKHEAPPEPLVRRLMQGKPSWVMLALLLFAGIASGIYLGNSRAPFSLPGRAPIASGTVESSGASDVPEQDNAPAPIASAPPATSAPSAPAAPSTPSTPVPAAQAPAKPPTETLASAPPETDRATGAKQESLTSNPLPSSASSEIDAWRKASAADKASAYEGYLRDFPKGRYAGLAKLRLERMEPKTGAVPLSLPKEAKTRTAPPVTAPATQSAAPLAAAPPAASKTPSSAEEDLWTTVTTINEAPAYESYLIQYPKGRYAALAKDRLKDPRIPEPAPTIRELAAAQAEAPKADRAEPKAPEVAPKQASIKPPEPLIPAPRAVPEAASKPVPDAPVAASKRTITFGDQTMTGNFTPDPKTGIVSGTGKIIWSNGDQFEGTLVQGKKEGKGKFSWHNGQRYNGEWARDMPNGKGSIVFADGSRYEGDVRDGVPHGQGTTRFKSGDVYDGAWARGKSQGQGRYTWANGSYWEGEFRDDKRTENGRMVFSESALGRTASTPQPPLGEARSAERPVNGRESSGQ